MSWKVSWAWGAGCQSTDLTQEGSGRVAAMSSRTKTQLLYEVLPNETSRWGPRTKTHADKVEKPITHQPWITKCQIIPWGFDLFSFFSYLMHHNCISNTGGLSAVWTSNPGNGPQHLLSAQSTTPDWLWGWLSGRKLIKSIKNCRQRGLSQSNGRHCESMGRKDEELNPESFS